MVFKERKIPRHLIIREEYELRKRPGKGVWRIVLIAVLVIGFSYVVSAGLIAV